MKLKSRYVGRGANGSAVYVVEDEHGDRHRNPASRGAGSKLFSAAQANDYISKHESGERRR
jgi:hypothetical protein